MNFIFNGIFHDNDEFNYQTKGGKRARNQILRIWGTEAVSSKT